MIRRVRPTLLASAPGLLATCALFAGSCREVPVELDPGYGERASLCEGVTCDGLPRCEDGGAECVACRCCPCEAGATACDPARTSVRWQCQDGCFVDDPCRVGETCVVRAPGAICIEGGVDCSRLELMGGPVICGETEALCAECGTCIDCADTGGRDACGALPRTEGSVLHCAGPSGCMSRVACDAAAPCVLGVESGLAACGDDLDCQVLGCTGYPVCGLPAAACGSCGCCSLAGAPRSRCARTPTGFAIQFLREAGDCYQEYPCREHELCVYDTQSMPACVRPR